MKVTGYGTIKPATTTRRTGGTSSASRFADVLAAASAGGAGAASEVVEVSQTASLSGLLALQEVSEEERKRERTLKQGKTMLDALEKLRQQLLIGEIPAHTLSELEATLAQQREAVSDPHLLALMDDIELRVAVELAKLEMSLAARSEL